MKFPLLTATSLLILSNSSVAAPTVTGNIISWPDDGWYQVQSSSDYTTVCNGGSSCVVEPGTYKVINHTTGEQFRGIEVGVTEVPDVTDNPIVVTGSSISWPDDGWYQVQNEQTHMNICEGRRSCDVEDGTYVVINHSSGVRFNNIVVQNEQPNISDEFSLYDTAKPLLYSLGMFQSEPLAIRVSLFADAVINSSTGETLSEDVTIPEGSSYVDPRRFDLINSKRYNCGAGGTLIIDQGVNNNSRSQGSLNAHYLNYRFDQCEQVLSDSTAIDGTYSVSGSLRLEFYTASSRSEFAELRNRWTDMTLRIDGTQFALDGVVDQSSISSGSGIFTRRTASFDRYEKANDTRTEELLENVNVDHNLRLGIGNRSLAWGVDGSIRNESTGFNTVSIASNPPLLNSLDNLGGPVTTISGNVEFSATDGSFLTMSANPERSPSVDRGIAVDVDYTAGNGDSQVLSGLQLEPIVSTEFWCIFERFSSEDAINCQLNEIPALP